VCSVRVVYVWLAKVGTGVTQSGILRGFSSCESIAFVRLGWRLCMYRIWYGCLVTLVGKVSNRSDQSGILRGFSSSSSMC